MAGETTGFGLCPWEAPAGPAGFGVATSSLSQLLNKPRVDNKINKSCPLPEFSDWNIFSLS